jgi:hypothetical protein
MSGGQETHVYDSTQYSENMAEMKVATMRSLRSHCSFGYANGAISPPDVSSTSIGALRPVRASYASSSCAASAPLAERRKMRVGARRSST